MPTLERMENTLDSMRTNIDAMIQAAPPEARPDLERAAEIAMQDLDNAVAEKRRQAESRRPDVAGDRYVEPRPSGIEGFKSRAKGSDIHYFRDTPTGEKLAFVDNGKQVKIHDWQDRETVRAALQLSAEKWDGLTIQGNEQYKSLVVTLAAEHSFKITNPELQERIAAERQRLGKEEPVKETAAVREAAPQQDKAKDAPVHTPTLSTATETKTENAGKAEGAAPKSDAPAERKPAEIPPAGPDEEQKQRMAQQMRSLENRATMPTDPRRPEAKPQDVSADQKELLAQQLRAIEARAAPPAMPAESASKPEAPAAKAEASAPQSAAPEKKTAERPPMVGALVEVGEGRYKGDPKNDVSQYVDLKTEDGRVHRIWSVQVAKDVKAAGAQPGDLVKAEYRGIEQVSKPIPVRDEKTGEVTHREERPVERGVWRTEVVRQVQQDKPEGQGARPESARAAEAPERPDDQRQVHQRQEIERRQTHKPRNRP